MNKKNNLQGGMKAQALIELALLLPLILLLVLGVMDFGRMFFHKIVLTNAAREGANYLSRNPDDQEDSYIVTYEVIITEADSSGVTLTKDEITINECCTVGNPVEVSVSNTVDLIFDSFLQSLGLVDGPIELTSTARMMVQ